MSQQELAERSALSVRAIGNLERGCTRWPHPDTMRRLADALELRGQARQEFMAGVGPRPACATATAAPASRGQPSPGAGSGTPVPRQLPDEAVHLLTARIEAHRAAAEPELAAPRALVARCSLPPDTAAFTGRDHELDLITAALADASVASGVVRGIHTIEGMPGVGKTALAVRAAYLLKDRFPDGHLFIDLHGHTPGQDPVLPEAALAGLLAAAGVDARYLPVDLPGRAGLWRDKVAGQRILLVLDNAASSDQVAPLLPGSGDCLVMVTSRRHLGDLPGPVVPVQVDTLPPDQAQEMFLRLAPRAATGPATVLAELVRLAGYLPLAISLVARVYVRHWSWTLADLAAETSAGMLTLAAENDSVAAGFEMSYRYLTPARQQFFRRLGLHPGTTTDPYAAAALAGLPLREAAGLLDALHGEGLLTETGYRRYGMHDLIRCYARDLAATDPAPGREQALDRLLDYYQHTAVIAQTLLARQSRTSPATCTPPPGAVPCLQDRGRALAWARTERNNLLACLDHATGAGLHARVVALTASFAALLRQDGPWSDAIIRHGAAAQAARHLGDRRDRADALSDLGAARRLTGDYPGAAEALQEALGIYRELGDRLGEGNVLYELGVARRLVTGDYRGGAEALQEALGIYRELGDRLGEGNALSELGTVRLVTSDYRDAAEALEEALGIYRDLGDRLGEGNTLRELGTVRLMTGDYRDAAEALEQALGISRDLGDRLGQGNALNELGAARRLTGDYRGAAEAQEEALGIFRDLGHRLGQGYALTYLGAARRLTGDYRGAAEAQEEALGIFRDLGHRQGEAEALNEAGALHRLGGDLDQAGACHRQALTLAREADSPLDEACALAGLGRCARAAGHPASACASLRQAYEIFDRIGAADAADVAGELRAIIEAGPPAERCRRSC